MNTTDRTHFKPARGRRPQRARRRSRGGAGWVRQRGSATIEFPFAVLILMLMLIFVADLGRLTPWAQQVAYSADALAQFAYQRYSQDGTQYRDEEDNLVDFSSIKTAVEDYSQLAEPMKSLGISKDDIKIEESRECPNLTLLSGNTFKVTYDDKCEDDEKASFIEVTVTKKFEPFASWLSKVIDQIRSKDEKLFELTFSIRRQIF